MDRFNACLAIVLKHEGGWVDHPRDPGGATNLGVTIGALSDWLGRKATKAEVRALTVEAVRPIYRRNYWDATRCHAYAPGADLCVFDAAVNSGPGRARQWAAQVRSADAAAFVNRYCDIRLGFLQRLRHWDAFGRGWSRRVADIRARGLRMALDIAPAATPAAKRAALESAAGTARAKGVRDGRAAGAVAAPGAATPAVVAVSDTAMTALQWGALAGVCILIAGAVAYLVIRSTNRRDEADALSREAALV
jgi:lysozyme family protein